MILKCIPFIIDRIYTTIKNLLTQFFLFSSNTNDFHVACLMTKEMLVKIMQLLTVDLLDRESMKSVASCNN